MKFGKVLAITTAVFLALAALLACSARADEPTTDAVFWATSSDFGAPEDILEDGWAIEHWIPKAYFLREALAFVPGNPATTISELPAPTTDVSDPGVGDLPVSSSSAAPTSPELAGAL